MTGDLDELRRQFPGWEFDTLWILSNSGPDQRRLVATRGTMLLAAWTAGDLAAVIRRVGEGQ